MWRGVPFLLNCTTVYTSASRHSSSTQGTTTAMACTVPVVLSSSITTFEVPSSGGTPGPPGPPGRAGSDAVPSQPMKSLRMERG